MDLISSQQFFIGRARAVCSDFRGSWLALPPSLPRVEPLLPSHPRSRVNLLEGLRASAKTFNSAFSGGHRAVLLSVAARRGKLGRRDELPLGFDPPDTSQSAITPVLSPTSPVACSVRMQPCRANGSPAPSGAAPRLSTGRASGRSLDLADDWPRKRRLFFVELRPNAYSNPVFLTVYSNATQTWIFLGGRGRGGADASRRRNISTCYRVVGCCALDLAAGYTPLQGGLSLPPIPCPLRDRLDGVPLPLFVGIQPHHQVITTNTLICIRLFEQRVSSATPAA